MPEFNSTDTHSQSKLTTPPATGSKILDIPQPTPQAGRRALGAILKNRSVLPALTVFHEELGDVFQISLGSFRPVFMVGPEATRFVLVTARDQLLWRPENDPVTKLLRNGLLVTDGQTHDEYRGQVSPSLHRTKLKDYVEKMSHSTDRVIQDWSSSAGPVDMLVEMRRIALLIVMQTLFRVDILPDLDRLFPAILDVLRYISPGMWTVWPGVPRFGYDKSIRTVDEYLYGLIDTRRAEKSTDDDLLTRLVETSGMNDDLIRDQMLTLLIAGHDTSTALLAWALYLLGEHTDVAIRVQEEVDTVLGKEAPTFEGVSQLKYMDQFLSETMRLYPPIHIGNRIAATDIHYGNYLIPQGTRVVYSIYLTHRERKYWPEPERFDPSRFSDDENRNRTPYSYLPFGGGRRNCIGAAFAQVEAKVVLSRVLQKYHIRLDGRRVHPHMGATLEPRPGVMISIRER